DRPPRLPPHGRGGELPPRPRPRARVPEGDDRGRAEPAPLARGAAGGRARHGRGAAAARRHRAERRVTGPSRVGYLGPPGTFAEEALLALLGPGHEAEPVPFPSVADCVQALVVGDVRETLVPIENSIEGSVNQTLDLLAFGPAPLVVRA